LFDGEVCRQEIFHALFGEEPAEVGDDFDVFRYLEFLLKQMALLVILLQIVRVVKRRVQHLHFSRDLFGEMRRQDILSVLNDLILRKLRDGKHKIAAEQLKQEELRASIRPVIGDGVQDIRTNGLMGGNNFLVQNDLRVQLCL